MTRLNS